MLHSCWSVVVHAASVSLSKESLMVSVGSLVVVVVAAAVHWAPRWRLKIHVGVRLVEHIVHIFGLILLDLNVITVDLNLQINRLVSVTGAFYNSFWDLKLVSAVFPSLGGISVLVFVWLPLLVLEADLSGGRVVILVQLQSESLFLCGGVAAHQSR